MTTRLSDLITQVREMDLTIVELRKLKNKYAMADTEVDSLIFTAISVVLIKRLNP